MGEYAKALEYYQTALNIREKALDPEHPEVATSYFNIAGAFWNQGAYSQALKFFQKSLTIREKVLGPEHPVVASTYSCIGLTLYKQGELDKALEWLLKAENIMEKNVTPELIQLYDNIGVIYREKGNFSKAGEYQKKARLNRPFLLYEKVLTKQLWHRMKASDL